MNINDRIFKLLEHKFELYTMDIKRAALGVGGDTFFVRCKKVNQNNIGGFICTKEENNQKVEEYVLKFPEQDSNSKPETEADLCKYMNERGFAVSRFVPNLDGSYISIDEDGRVFHLQIKEEGKTYTVNTAPDWLMRESALTLGRMHQILREYTSLPEGIGAGFFQYMTPESAKGSYLDSLQKARELHLDHICECITFRLEYLKRIQNISFDVNQLTCCNTHGDYTINQLICGEDKINAVIDWTCACVHPVIWELARSYAYASPECAQGVIDRKRFNEYVETYTSQAPLNEYDRSNLLNVYLYQIAVCDYYGQYLNSSAANREDFLWQADFATNILKHNDIQR